MNQKIKGLINLTIGWMELNRSALLILLAVIAIIVLSMVYVHIAYEYYLLDMPRWHAPPSPL